MAELKAAKINKRCLKSNITKFKEKLHANINDADKALILVYEAKIASFESELKQIFESILSNCEESEIDEFIAEKENIIETLDDIILTIKRKSLDISLVQNTESESSISHKDNVSEVKLPKLSLPIFYGKTEEWLEFRDLFCAAVHTNANLTNAQKLQYLKSSCKGDALAIIQAISISDANYETAWNLLSERYSNKKDLVNAIIKKLLSLHPPQDTSHAILKFVDSVNECLRALKNLEQKVNEFSDTLILYILVEKLDRNTRSWWERNQKSDQIATIEELITFLKEHARTLIYSKPMQKEREAKRPFHSSKVFLTDAKGEKCILSCSESHALHRCPVYKKMTVSERMHIVKSFNRCYLCLNNHRLSECKQMKLRCSICSKRHHVTLHYPRENKIEQATNSSTDHLSLNAAAPEFRMPDNENKNNDLSLFSMNHCNLATDQKTIFLSTFICFIKDESGNWYRTRGILDVGANRNFISKKLIDKLNLKKEKINISVSGLSEMSIEVKSKVKVSILSKDKQFNLQLDCLVVPRITDLTPYRPLEISRSLLSNIHLADENFNLPGPVDILVGAEKFYELLRPGQIYPDNTNLVLQNSVFGYIVSGSVPTKSEINGIHCGLITDNNELEKTLKKFWEVEDIQSEPQISKSKELEICDEHFLKNYSRDSSGRYIVQMPLKEEPSCLGDSRQRALKCFKSLQNRMLREPEFYSLYKNFMSEYINMNHMEEVRKDRIPENEYYIPHHGVLRTESRTTPLRVVFNASSSTTSGKSLNDIQFVGGVIQEDLYSIMLRFRCYNYVIISDIRKMYRMIQIHPSQRDLLRIFWSPDPSEEIKTYRLCTVTYGTSSAPFLATRTLQQLVKDEGNNFPLAASVLMTDVYMDDILTGANDLRTAKKLQQQLISLLEKGCFELHKWATNDPSLLIDNSESNDYSFNNDTKTLGILWSPASDTFGFNFIIDENSVHTKRAVLAQIAKIFDPLGLIGPIITTAKVFLQKLWSLNLEWSETLPVKENLEWNAFLESLKCVKMLKIPRFCIIEQHVELQLHGFSDASEIAYGAVIYIKSTNSVGGSIVRLLTSKSRVAPIKKLTIPRLELSAAVLLAKLMKKTTTALKQEFTVTQFWSDSTIVLAWLRKEPSNLKTFVANRVATIQELTSVNQWRHVSSKDNPADFISRGMDPSKIHHCDLWWFGPPFLHKGELFESGEIPPIDNEELFLSEIKAESITPICVLINTSESLDIINNCSSFTKMQRTIAWCKRFIYNARNPLNKLTGNLSCSELNEAVLCIVRSIQATAFAKEINCLNTGKDLPNNSKLLNLCPFLDENGILRVGGRLKNCDIQFNKKHPMLLPNKHNFTNAVINHFHLMYFHTGAETTLSLIREYFWILCARNIVRKRIFECLRCRQVSAKPSSQLMADLPKERVNIARTFSKVGLDYCGPFKIKIFVSRGKQFRKVYVCIFVCFVTKALHFEVVHDLTTSAFLAAFKRFISRRGKPLEVFSDNGRNFVGANNELKSIIRSLYKNKSKEEIEKFIASEGVKWHFNPPSTPHFGGLWEASVKSLKYHLKRVIGETILSLEEFLTLVTQIEAVLNSRPLCPLSNDPNDVEALTPGHFIIGSSLVALPEPNYTEVQMNRLNRWQLVQRLTQQVWKQWSSAYLNTLVHRPKWYRGNTEIKEGDLILVKNPENSSFLKWGLARVLKVHPGKDDRVRVVTLKDKNGIYKRPITKIVTLPYKD